MSASPASKFLHTILSNRDAGSSHLDGLPLAVPTWKEDLVERVRRRKRVRAMPTGNVQGRRAGRLR